MSSDAPRRYVFSSVPRRERWVSVRNGEPARRAAPSFSVLLSAHCCGSLLFCSVIRLRLRDFLSVVDFGASGIQGVFTVIAFTRVTVTYWPCPVSASLQFYCRLNSKRWSHPSVLNLGVIMQNSVNCVRLVNMIIFTYVVRTTYVCNSLFKQFYC
jgi:hypothetical protein